MKKGPGRKKRVLITLFCVLAALAAALAVTAALYIPIGGRLYGRRSEALDLREVALTAQDYDALCQKLPECDIRWSVPLFYGGRDSASASVVISHLDRTDLALFKYFDRLTVVDATECGEHELLGELRSAYPELDIRSRVLIGGENVDAGVRSLSFAGKAGPDVEGLCLNSRNLYALEELDFTGCGLTGGQIGALREAFPEARLTYDYTVCGLTFPSDAEELDLSGVKMDGTEEIEAALPYFPLLKKVVMCDCGISGEDMDALDKRHEDIRFVWRIYFCTYSLRTDETSFISARFPNQGVITDYDTVPLKYCTDMLALDLGHMNITDLSFLQYMPKLQYLIAADSYVSDISYIGEYCPELIYLELFMCPVRDVSPLVKCEKLKDLNLCYTQISDVSPLMELTQLDYLWYGGNVISYADQKALTEALGSTEIYFVREQSTGGGWRYHEHYYDMRDALDIYYMPYGNTRPE